MKKKAPFRPSWILILITFILILGALEITYWFLQRPPTNRDPGINDRVTLSSEEQAQKEELLDSKELAERTKLSKTEAEQKAKLIKELTVSQ